MNENFFNIVEPSFFNVFIGRNKEINYDVLKMINDKMKDDIESYEKKEIVSWVKEFIDNHPSFQKIDDENEEVEWTDNQDWANAKINYFVKNGWLSSETIGFKQVFSMNSAGISVLNAMNDVVRNETKPIEYTGYVYNIYNTLMAFDTNRATPLIETLEKTANEFNNSLRSVNLSIKKFINSLLKNADINAKSVLRTLLVDYHDNVVEKVFTNLRTGDNPSKYKGEIIAKIDNLLDNNFNQLIDNYLKTKKITDRVEAEKYVEESLYLVRGIFENINDNIEILNKKNEKYVQSANARAQFLLNNDKNVEGEIYETLRLFDSKNVVDEDEFPFGLKDLGKIGENSIYKYTKRKLSGTIQSNYVRPIIDEEYKRQESERLQRSAKFNVKNVDKWILNKIGNKNFVEAKQIELANYDDLIILFLLTIYEKNGLMNYIIEPSKEGDFVYFGNSRLHNFTVRRKIHE